MKQTVTMTTSETGKKAFTFIELLCVTIIIGILIGAALPVIRKSLLLTRLNAHASEISNFIVYLRNRSMLEKEIIYLYIDSAKKQCWAIKACDLKRIKTIPVTCEIKMGPDKEKMGFYPDGTIDKTEILLSAPGNEEIILTTKGIFGGVKVLSKQ